ncbi:MAG: hypothetical protein GX213_10095 [Clostridiaceae bacterium]|nr:hypothetical protein [Clostridiaceae bacterium]
MSAGIPCVIIKLDQLIVLNFRRIPGSPVKQEMEPVEVPMSSINTIVKSRSEEI